jgi:hypothetical protein
MKIEFKGAKVTVESKELLKDELVIILDDIKNKYGDLDNCFELVAIEFKNQHPQLFFENNDITIILGDYTFSNVYRAIWQMSHECIHLLSPETQISGIKPNNLEEGLATLFSRKYIQDKYNWNFEDNDNPVQKKYNKAASYVVKLLDYDKDIIKQVRELQPSLSRISVDDLISINPNLDLSLCEDLCREF